MKKLLAFALFTVSFLFVNAQTTFDASDSVANEQKHYTIQIDVTNGNIYLPIKKKSIRIDTAKLKFPSSNEYFSGRKYQVLYKDATENGKIIKVPFDTLFYNTNEKAREKKFVVGKKYFTPSVGNFIRIIFLNVPKDEDVNASVNFQDKNQESAAAFNNVLTKYQGTFDKGVDKDSTKIKFEIGRQINKEEIETIIKTKTKDSINSENILKILKQLDKISEDATAINLLAVSGKEKNRKNDDSKHKIDTANEIRIQIDNILGDLTLDKEIDSNRQAKLKVIKTKLVDIKDYLNEAADLIIKGDTAYKNLKYTIKYLSSSINDTKKELANQYKIVLDSLINLLNKSDSVYIRFRDSVYEKRTIRVIPFQVENTDLSVISFQFKRKGEVYAEREILLKNNKGFKLDFSTGFVGSTLKDENYRLYNGPNDSSAILSDPKGKFTVGFGLLAHAYFRTGSRWNVSLTSGFALNGSNQTINYILGASLPLGLEQRFIISAGAIFGKVKKLSEGYKTSSNLDSLMIGSRTFEENHWYKSISNTGVPLTEKWSNGFFLSITYNLGTILSSKQNRSYKIN